MLGRQEPVRLRNRNNGSGDVTSVMVTLGCLVAFGWTAEKLVEANEMVWLVVFVAVTIVIGWAFTRRR